MGKYGKDYSEECRERKEPVDQLFGFDFTYLTRRDAIDVRDGRCPNCAGVLGLRGKCADAEFWQCSNTCHTLFVLEPGFVGGSAHNG